MPEAKSFRDLNLQYDILVSPSQNDYFDYKMENFSDLYKLINNLSIRRFTYTLLEPILKEEYTESSINIKNNNLLNEIILLKKYLKRFNYNYRRYFCDKYYNNLPPDKEINSYAIESLFLLTGI